MRCVPEERSIVSASVPEERSIESRSMKGYMCNSQYVIPIVASLFGSYQLN
ncbi:MAG: hypothetical protein HC942_27460 [Microcoleus sp. SU_5_6]|nr:hypothetical protein [Microcoleus sp. SU_5_6]